MIFLAKMADAPAVPMVLKLDVKGCTSGNQAEQKYVVAFVDLLTVNWPRLDEQVFHQMFCKFENCRSLSPIVMQIMRTIVQHTPAIHQQAVACVLFHGRW